MTRPLAPAAGLVAVSLLLLMPSGQAQAARFYDPALQAPSLVEPVACRTVRERIVRPSGRVIYRVKNICAPGWRRPWAMGGCRLIRERIVRPNGAIVFRTVRRCP
jgi:hypothetical protein